MSPVEMSILMGVTSFPMMAFIVIRIPGYSISSMMLNDSLISNVTPSPISISLISVMIRFASFSERLKFLRLVSISIVERRDTPTRAVTSRPPFIRKLFL